MNVITKYIIVLKVATVLTVYGIETFAKEYLDLLAEQLLQQSLPFTVLKLICNSTISKNGGLQQSLPFTVLKL